MLRRSTRALSTVVRNVLHANTLSYVKPYVPRPILHLTSPVIRFFATSVLKTCDYIAPLVLNSHERTFTVNGAIRSPSHKLSHFFVDPTSVNAHTLLPLALQGNFITLIGNRASGKTTSAAALKDQLISKGIVCLMTTFETAVDTSSRELFWTSFSKRLRVDNKIAFPVCNNAMDFADSFGEFEGVFKSSVTLIIDEFDRIYTEQTLESGLLDEVLSTFRGIKQNPEAYSLKSVVVIGPFSMFAATGRSTSPFNIECQVPAKPFSKVEVKKLFAEFTATRECTLDDRIVNDIYTRTNGHKGLVNLCGKYIDEELRAGTSGDVTFDIWLQGAIMYLPAQIHEWGTMKKLVSIIKSEDPLIEEARQLLLDNFFAALEPVEFTEASEVPALQLLVNEGIIMRYGEEYYGFTSPFVRALMLYHVKAKNVSIPNTAPPIEAGVLNLRQLVVGALPHFNKAAIMNLLSSKQTRTAGLPREVVGDDGVKRPFMVPNEAIYNHQHYSVMHAWLPRKIRLNVETSASGKYCDIVITHNVRYVIEYIASATQKELVEHLDRASHYIHQMKAVQLLVVNFTMVDPRHPSTKQYPLSNEPGVEMMHIFHNSDFTRAIVRVGDIEEELDL